MEAITYEVLSQIQAQHWWFKARLKFFRKLLSKFQIHATASLDIGCGSGSNFPLLKDFSNETYGLDVSAQALHWAQKNYPEIHLLKGDVNDLDASLHEKNFSLISILSVLYHRAVVDDQKAVMGIAKHLKPGGVVLFMEPALPFLWRYHDTQVQGRKRYTKAEIQELYEKAGLEVVRLSYCNFIGFFPALLLAMWERALSHFRHVDASQQITSELKLPPAPINWLMEKSYNLEFFLITHGITLPFGVSLIGMARKAP